MERSEYAIIILALSRVDSKYSSTALSLASELSANNRILYINHPYTYKEVIRDYSSNRKIRKLIVNLIFRRVTIEKDSKTNYTSIVPPPTLPINWIPESKLYDYLQKVNDRIISKVIRTIIKKGQLDKYIFFNIHDPYFRSFFHEKFNPMMRIYMSVDDLSQDGYGIKHGVSLEQLAAKKSNLVLATSFHLQKKLKDFNLNVQILNNAVDFTLFNRSLTADFTKPKELLPIKGPIIGYTGNLDDTRLDFELISMVASKFPDHTVLLIGPINSKEYYTNQLDQIKNILWLGPKNITELPLYLKYMDVVLIPFKVNKLTASIYPLKVNEYLAAGKNVVSTAFSPDISLFRDVIMISSTKTEFLDNVGKALQNKPDQQMIDEKVEVAKRNTWTARVDQFWEYVESTASGNRLGD